MLSSDGHAISALERILLERQPARSCWEKYFGCFSKKSPPIE